MSKILVVDPDRESALLYCSALSAKSHEVKLAVTAQEALYITEEFQPEKIILELDIPGHNGFEFLYELISYRDWENMEVIVHSNLREDTFQRMFVPWDELGVSAYLYKPETTLQQLQSVT